MLWVQRSRLEKNGLFFLIRHRLVQFVWEKQKPVPTESKGLFYSILPNREIIDPNKHIEPKPMDIMY